MLMCSYKAATILRAKYLEQVATPDGSQGLAVQGIMLLGFL